MTGPREYLRYTVTQIIVCGTGKFMTEMREMWFHLKNEMDLEVEKEITPVKSWLPFFLSLLAIL